MVGGIMHSNISKSISAFIGFLLVISCFVIIIPSENSCEMINGDVFCPGHAPTGLTWQSGPSAFLWNADYEENTIYKIVPSDGNVVHQFLSPGNHPKGLTWDGQYLWNVDSADELIYQINPVNGSIVHQISTPLLSNATGLTFDGTNLWVADDTQDLIYELDPVDGSIITSMSSPGKTPTGLTWDGAYLWNADYMQQRIYVIDPVEGDVVYHIESSREGPWGLAWHQGYIYNADDMRDRIYTVNTSFMDNQPPVAQFDFYPSDPEPSESVVFNASSSYDPDGSIVQWYWDFDDDDIYDNIANVTPPAMNWDLPGQYPVSLVVMIRTSLMN